jgi:arylsulfatase A-like enzyme
MRTLLCTILLSLFFVAGAKAAPNIVVILTDDQEDTGSMAYLPNVQALAAQGVTFKNSFVDFSLCAPSRSSFLTGQAAHNDGIKSNKLDKGGGWDTFKQNEANDLAVWLKAAGYQTALIGKYENATAPASRRGLRAPPIGRTRSMAGSGSAPRTSNTGCHRAGIFGTPSPRSATTTTSSTRTASFSTSVTSPPTTRPTY